MNKRIIHGLLFVVTAAVSMGTLSSCKDNQSDTWTEIESQQVTLQGKISDLESQLLALKATQSNCQVDCATEIQNLKDKIANSTSQADITILEGRIANLEALQEKVTTIEGTLTTLDGKIANVKSKLEGDIDDLKQELEGEINGLSQKIDSIDLSGIEKDIEDLQTELKTVEDDLDALTKKVDAILGRLNKLVTGVLVQGTENPVLGSYSSPFNTQSNIVMAYYGTNTTDITEFPTVRSAQEFNGNQVITSADWKMLGKNGGSVKTVSFDSSAKYLMHDDEGNAGKIYVTINPNNVDFTGLTATLVNSRDEESGIKLGSLTKSDKLLSFGTSRSSDDNGFYEATATVTPDEIPNVKINVESSLKSAFKDVLSSRSEKSFMTLANALYNQISNYLPAEGIKVAWTAADENGVEQDYAVYSQYNIAATAFKPLSFKFLAGTSLGSLPTISPLSGLSIDKSKFHFNIDLKPFELSGIDIQFGLKDIQLKSDSIYVEVKGSGKSSTTNEIIEVEASGTVSLDKFVSNIQDSFSTQISGWNTDMKKAFDDAINDLVAQIKTQVNSMMSDVTAQINDGVDKIIDEILSEVNESGIFSRVNSYINKYNSIATRINNILSNPNNYLQAMLAYEANGSLQFMSTTSGLPSPVELNGGDAITLYATTYTAELVVPTFYKFVGVSNAWVNGDQSKSAQKGNSGAKNALTSANATEYMATPINGNQYKVPMKLTSGYTYEIVYSALDFHGVTSTRKFYLSVK